MKKKSYDRLWSQHSGGRGRFISEFKDSHGYTEKPCLKNTKNKTSKKKTKMKTNKKTPDLKRSLRNSIADPTLARLM